MYTKLETTFCIDTLKYGDNGEVFGKIYLQIITRRLLLSVSVLTITKKIHIFLFIKSSC